MTSQPDQARDRFPTARGRQTRAAIDAAAREVIARKGVLATTICDIAMQARRSTASVYNYYDSKEEWSANGRCASATRPTNAQSR